ncbi:MAG: diguanylate cyclase, partial [Bdellovibrionales bacterium]|nr:diguanylate cyclase [Bdellovibrionales bacterium]
MLQWHLVAFVVLLVGVYFNFTFAQIFSLYAIQTCFYSFQAYSTKNALPTFVEWSIFSLWCSGLVLFWYLERRKRFKLKTRLEQLTQESKILSARSDILIGELNLREKKFLHRNELIKKRSDNLTHLIEVLFKTLNPHAVALYFYDPLAELFHLKECVSQGDQNFVRRVELEGIFLAVSRENGPVALHSNNHVRAACYYQNSNSIKSVVGVPLCTNSFLHGVLLVDDENIREFNDLEIEIMLDFAKELTTTIEDSELLQSYFNLKEELTAFYEASSKLNQCFRVSDVLETLLMASMKITRYDHSAVILFDQKTATNRVALEMGHEKMGWEDETFSCAGDRGLISWVIRNKMPLAYHDFRARNSQTPLFHKRWKIPNVYDSVLILPLFVSQESLGAVLFLAESKNAFSKSIKKLLEVVSLQASISMKNATMVHDLEKLATTDGLTGLYNHRTFQERLMQEFSRGERHPSSFSLLLIDIDFFKEFNDEYGHPVGDFVLRQVSGLLAQTVRKVDHVARYGGEEFAIILVNTDQGS